VAVAAAAAAAAAEWGSGDEAGPAQQ